MIYMYSSQHGRDWCGSLWRHAHERSILKIHAAQVHVHVSFHTSHTIGDKPHHRSLIRSTAIWVYCTFLPQPRWQSEYGLVARGIKFRAEEITGQRMCRRGPNRRLHLLNLARQILQRRLRRSDTVYIVQWNISSDSDLSSLASLDWLWRMRSSSLVGRLLGHAYHVVMWTEPRYWPMPKLKNSFWSSDLIR
jgi:hypothetical protein